MFTATYSVDRLISDSHVNGRLVDWLIGGGIYAISVGAVIVILDAGRRWTDADSQSAGV